MQGCAPTTTVTVSGTGYRFSVSASGVTIKDLAIQKTDKTGEQNIIWMNADNFTLKNTVVSGQFVIGDGEVSRAIVVSGGHSGMLIEGNTFHSLRQPMYLTGPTTGLIKNNYTYGTKGWVLEGGDVTFTGNTWGSGAGVNVRHRHPGLGTRSRVCRYRCREQRQQRSGDRRPAGVSSGPFCTVVDAAVAFAKRPRRQVSSLYHDHPGDRTGRDRWKDLCGSRHLQ
ncbi:MAG: right-handed parallel beta-helix repeat-containing protein [Ignavibacteriae bacterium]|nr:right-handed parallel beta-helix repeat-containing protein [Ignavibacteriota bacterium]